MNEEITVLDLFSGIGGFSLGLEAAGPFRTIAFCEQDKFCQAVLRKHWPNVPIFDDVRTISTDGLRRVDIIVGGFPCQPWSQAGEQRGAEDDRDLWPEMARLVGELRPKYLIGENVRGFVNQRMGLERSLSDLASIGYQTVPFIIPACAVDAPHRRDRVWIVAHAESAGAGVDHRGVRTGSQRIGRGQESASVAHANGEGEPNGTVDERPRSGQLVADAAQLHSDGGKFHGKYRETKKGKFGRGSGTKSTPYPGSERLQGAGHEPRETGDAGAGQPVQLDSEVRGQWRAEPGMGGVANGVPGWLDEPDCGRVASGVKNRVPRLKALGNAVVPQVVAEIGRAILAAEGGE